MVEQYKFQKMPVYQMGLAYTNAVYELSRCLVEPDRLNLSSQVESAATSIVLHIAEGTTCQTDSEQSRHLEQALRSYLETIACLDLIERRFGLPPEQLTDLREQGHELFLTLSASHNTFR